MHFRLHRLLAVGTLAVSLATPLATTAATLPTPQQALDAALKDLVTHQRASAVDGRLSFTYSDRRMGQKAAENEGKFSLRTVARNTAGAPAQQQVEGEIFIEHFHAMDGDETLRLSSPFSIEWKYAEQTLFARVKNLPEDLKAELPEEALRYVGPWLRFAVPKEVMEQALANQSEMGLAQLLEALAKSNNLSATDLRALQRLSKMSIFRVTRVEKREVVNGQTLWRMRMTVNPQLISEIQSFALRQAAKDYPAGSARNTEIKNINASFVQVRRVLARTGFVAVVDPNTQRLTRFEIGGSYSEPKKDWVYNSKTQRSVERVVGTQTFTIALGLSLKNGPDTAVQIPADSIDLYKAGSEMTTGVVMPVTTEPMMLVETTSTAPIATSTSTY